MTDSHLRIDVAIPTKESEPTLDGTLRRLRTAAANASDVSVERVVVVDDESEDGTVSVLEALCEEFGWDPVVTVTDSSLVEARRGLISAVDTDWFLFLDDDVRLEQDYLSSHAACIAPNVGAVQGRKTTRTEHPSDWVRRRARRGGTHATLVRRSALEDLRYPDDMTLLEDEWTRRHVEERGYLWVFNHTARFDHANRERHPIGWEEGRVAGKYGLAPFHQYALNVPYAIATVRSPVPHVLRAAGWLYGRVTT
jgi:glycosyltransferase involved in cell wall biosynthesis